MIKASQHHISTHKQEAQGRKKMVSSNNKIVILFVSLDGLGYHTCTRPNQILSK